MTRDHSPNLRVLIVEDEDFVADALTLYLEIEGCRVTRVRDGSEAVERVRRDEFDAVLLDVSLPVGDGIEIARDMRRARELPPTIIALATIVMLQMKLKEYGVGLLAD